MVELVDAPDSKSGSERSVGSIPTRGTNFAYNGSVTYDNASADILIVEDDLDYQAALCDILALEGYGAKGVATISEYQASPHRNTCSMLLLDRNLPDGDGLEILKRHRQQSNAPVIFITGEGSLEDRITGMDADADYYLVKPIKTDELLAIIRRCLRKKQSVPPACWVLDTVQWTLRDPEQNSLALTRTEMLLLKSLAAHSGVAVARDEIVNALGKSPDSYDFRRLEVAIRRLRKKLESSNLSALPLETVYGIGYVLNAELKVQSTQKTD